MFVLLEATQVVLDSHVAYYFNGTSDIARMLSEITCEMDTAFEDSYAHFAFTTTIRMA